MKQHDGIVRSAVMSDCGLYRYSLMRRLSPELWHDHLLPGTVDDATARKGWRYTTGWGYGCMEFINTNPWRSTDPKLARHPPEQALTINDEWLRMSVTESVITICAWGDKANMELARRAHGVMRTLGPLYAMRVTKLGNPQHPLYLPGDTKPLEWRADAYLN